MIKPLSPAAAAVLNAYSNGHKSDRHAVAAALRAVADQVVPECAQPSYGDDFSHGAWFARNDARDDLLRMADEIETF